MPKPIYPPKLAAQTAWERFGGKRGEAAFIAARQSAADTKVLALIDLKVPIVPSAAAAQVRWLSVADCPGDRRAE